MTKTHTNFTLALQQPHTSDLMCIHAYIQLLFREKQIKFSDKQ